MCLSAIYSVRWFLRLKKRLYFIASIPNIGVELFPGSCLLFLFLLLIAGCSRVDRQDLEQISSNSASGKTLIAAMGQGLLGDSIKLLNRREYIVALTAEYEALEYKKPGEVVFWGQNMAGNSGYVIPGQLYQVGSQNCRQYSHYFIINELSQTHKGSACRNLDGSWVPLL